MLKGGRYDTLSVLIEVINCATRVVPPLPLPLSSPLSLSLSLSLSHTPALFLDDVRPFAQRAEQVLDVVQHAPALLRRALPVHPSALSELTEIVTAQRFSCHIHRGVDHVGERGLSLSVRVLQPSAGG